MRTQLVGGPFDGKELELPEGTVTDPGTGIALPVSAASEPSGLQYAVYNFGASPDRAEFQGIRAP